MSSIKCEICTTNDFKYKCPGCSMKTCSLDCCRKHKTGTGCNGQRDKTKFVNKEDFDEKTLLNDYRFLEEQAAIINAFERTSAKIVENEAQHRGSIENLRIIRLESLGEAIEQPNEIIKTIDSSSCASGSSSSGDQTSILYPLQTVSEQQFAQLIDQSGDNQSSIANSNSSQFSSLDTSSNNTSMQYYNYQGFNNQHSGNMVTELQAQQQSYGAYDENNDRIDFNQQSNLNIAAELETQNVHSSQESTLTERWLLCNFEPADGCSLRRSILYNFYLHYCTESKLEPVNPASFGKLIRSVFPNLKTRRLGTRGNSKYHYNGIRVQPSSTLNQLAEDHVMAIRNHPMSLSPTGSPLQSQSPINTLSLSFSKNETCQVSPKKMKAPNLNNTTGSSFIQFDSSNIIVEKAVVTKTPSGTNIEYKPIITSKQNHQITQVQPASIAKVNNSFKNHHQIIQVNQEHIIQTIDSNFVKDTSPILNQNICDTTTANNDTSCVNFINLSQQKTIEQNISSNGLNDTVEPTGSLLDSILPGSGSIDTENIKLPDDCTMNDLKIFEEIHRQHSQRILEMMINLKTSALEWLLFWRSPKIENTHYNQYKDQLSTNKFFSLCKLSQVMDYVKKSDLNLFQFCIEVLIRDVFNKLPTELVHSIRFVAKNLEKFVRDAMETAPEGIKSIKLAIISTFSMILRRYTTLNHLIQTVHNSLFNEDLLKQMMSDLNKVDFNFVREQAKWSCNCDEKYITKYEKEFKDLLNNPAAWTSGGWIAWLETTVNDYMQPFEGNERYEHIAKQFLLKWSYICSSVIRDLTLRSAPSFGSFHLLHLFYDEYIYYLLEHKIAAEKRQTSLAVLTKFDLVDNYENSRLQEPCSSTSMTNNQQDNNSMITGSSTSSSIISTSSTQNQS